MNTAAVSASSGRRTAERTEQDKNSLDASQKITIALARIEASRAALIVCLSPDLPDRPPRAAGDGGAVPSFGQTFAARIERNGLLQGSWRTLRALVRRWRSRQPWLSTVNLVGETLAHEARPLMRRHPLATLAVGAAAGAGLVAVASAVRPWAWHHIRAKASPLGGSVGSLVWTQLTSAPVQIALASALAAWLADRGSHSARSTGPSGDASPRHARGEGSPGTETASVP